MRCYPGPFHVLILQFSRNTPPHSPPLQYVQGAPPCSAPAAFTSLLRLAQHATCPSGSYQPTRGYAGQEYLANKFPKGAFAASQTLGRPAGFRPSVVTSDHVFDPYQVTQRVVAVGICCLDEFMRAAIA